MRILVTKFRNIGDVLLSTPVIASLKKTYPEAEIHMAVNDFCKEVVQDNPSLDRVIVYQRPDKKAGPLHRIKHELSFYRQFVGQYDMVINLTEGDRGCLIAALSGAKVRMGYAKKTTFLNRLARYQTTFPGQERMHTVQKDLRFVAALDNNQLDQTVTLGSTALHQEQADNALNAAGINADYAVVHPVSRWMFKCWDEAKMAAAIDHLAASRDLKILITTSSDPVESAMAKAIAGLCKTDVAVLPEPLSLQAYACLVGGAKLFFGIDSAPMHIAASRDTPVVALFGASMADIWGPWDNSKGSNYRFEDGVQRQGLHTLIANTDMELYFDENGCKRSKGMMNLSLDTVLEALDEAI